MIGLIVFLAVLMGFLIWLRFSIWRVKPGEMGVKMMSGALDSHVCRSGFHFVPKFFGYGLLKISPQCTIDFPLISAFSKAASDCESEPLSVAVTLYLKFPQDAKICDIIRSGMPTSQDSLLKRLDPVVSEEVKSVFAETSWKVTIVSLDIVRSAIEEGLASRALFDDFTTNGGAFDLVIESVELPDALKQALCCYDQMKISAEAVKNVSDVNTMQPKSRSFISGQVFDGQATRFLNLTAEAPDSRALGQMYAAASRMTQKENGQQQKKGKGVPESFKVEDATMV